MIRSSLTWLVRRGLPSSVCIAALAGATLTIWAELDAQQHRLIVTDSAVAAIVFYSPDVDARESFLRRSIDLYNSGKVSRIVCVGGARPKRDYYGSVEMGGILIAAGVPPGKLLCNDRISDDSISNLQVASHMLGHEDFEKSVLVTDRLHGLRLRWLAKERLNLRVNWLSAPNYTNWYTVVQRAFWESASWIINVFPESVRREAIGLSRG